MRLINFLLLFLFVSGLAAAEIPLDQAQLPDCGSFQRDTLIIQVPQERRQGMNSAVITLPVKQMQGKRVLLYGTASAERLTLSKREKPWYGFKFMLVIYRKNGETQYLDAGTDTPETFSDRTLCIRTGIPQDAERLELHLGLQNVSGRAVFRNPGWQTEEEFFAPVRQSDRCVYSPAVRKRPVRRGVMSQSPPVQSGTAQNLEDLASWGANLIRWQLWTPPELTEQTQIMDWYKRSLDELERFLPLLERLGIEAVVDMHLPPGGRTENQQFRMFDEEKYLDSFVAVWQLIARRLKGKKMIYGYDLCNEPNQIQPVKYLNYIDCQYRAAEAIRKIDPETPVIVESNALCAPSAFAYLKPLPLKNIIYQVHMYQPMAFTHQGVHGAPRGIVYQGGIQYLRKILEPVRQFQQKYGAVIYCGEFSAVRWAEGAEQYLRDVITLCEEYNWSWTYHAFREWHGWSVEHSSDFHDMKKTERDTPRKKVLLEFFRRNSEKL